MSAPDELGQTTDPGTPRTEPRRLTPGPVLQGAGVPLRGGLHCGRRSGLQRDLRVRLACLPIPGALPPLPPPSPCRCHNPQPRAGFDVRPSRQFDVRPRRSRWSAPAGSSPPSWTTYWRAPQPRPRGQLGAPVRVWTVLRSESQPVADAVRVGHGLGRTRGRELGRLQPQLRGVDSVGAPFPPFRSVLLSAAALLLCCAACVCVKLLGSPLCA